MTKLHTMFYLIVQPVRRGYDGVVTAVGVDRILVYKPTKLGVRDIAIKVNLEVDERLFTVPAPEVTIKLDDERALILPTLKVVVPDDAGDADDAGESTVDGPDSPEAT